MSEVDWPRVAEIYADALELPLDQRIAFARAQCAEEPTLLDAVQRMLAAGDDAHPAFLTSISGDVLEEIAEDATTPLERVGPWRIVREIGRGGMGQVLLAERADGQFEQQVAIKLLKRGMDSDAILTRFLRERRILAALDHPNIARLLDGGIAEDGRPYFVMEYVDGESITAYADSRRLSVDARLTLFRTVCLAVEHAHRNLVVHRDLKPSNILVSADGRPKLLDFGIAKLLSSPTDALETSTLTATGGRLLTPDYAAPEQFLGGPITTATDVYGLGAVLFELLVGRAPFSSTDSADGSRQRRPDEEPRTASTALAAGAPNADAIAITRGTDAHRLQRQLAGDVDTIVATALRAAPDRRYASVGALHDDIVRHQQQMPVRARPDTLGYRVSRFVRRHRVAVLTAGTVAALLVAFGVTTAFQARALARERDRARLEAASAREVSEFLVGVFEVADPLASQRSGDPRASDLLDRGATRIESDLAAQPAVQARLLGVIGRAYDNLQRGDRADQLLARSVELERARAPGSPELVAALQWLGRARVRRSDFKQARDVFAEAVDIQRRLGPETAAMWGLLVELSGACDGTGNSDTAKIVRTEAIDLFRRLPPSAFGESRAELQRMAELLARGPDTSANHADSVFSRLVAIERGATSEDGAPVAMALSAWAYAKSRRRAYAEADSMLGAAEQIYGKVAPGSLALAKVLAQHTLLLNGAGDLARAESLGREAVRILIDQLGEGHREVALARMNLGFVLNKVGKTDEAIRLDRLNVETFKRDTNDAVNILPQVQWELGLMLYRSGQVQESLGDFAGALETFATRFPPTYLATAAVRRDYGAALVDAGRPADAEPILRQAIDVMSARYGADNARVDLVRITLGRSLAAQGKRAEARRVLTEVVTRLTASRGAEDSVTRRARGALGALE